MHYSSREGGDGMVEEATQNEPQAEAGTKKFKKSTIKFPYYDLNAGVELVRSIYSQRGNQCSLADLVAVLANFTTVESGAFRQLIAATSMFGLISVGGKEVTLTNRAQDILSPDDEAERRARADAFLSVPLFRAIFDQHSGRRLPPRVGMERTIEQLGVVETLSDRAYGTFVRSAEQAGFFEAGGRQYLVEPSMRRRVSVGGEQPAATGTLEVTRGERDASASAGGGPPAPPSGIHPAIMGLLQLLPPQGQPFPKPSRDTWLQAVGGALNLIYGKTDEGEKPDVNGGDDTNLQRER